jgi:uncharacterized protein YaiL (DUF2058 family)
MAWLSALPWLIAAFGLVAGGGGTLWYRSEFHECVAAREADRTAAEKAKNAALDAARVKSDQIITEQAKALAETAAKVSTVTERIIQIPVTTACATSPAMRAGTQGVRDLLAPK